ncbi:hypothetical protein U9M48_039065, partial [Paspalum notatum var. saurae]
IYFGEGEIRYDQFEVDLIGFRSMTKGLDRAIERPFRLVYNWFMKCFKLDHDECELRILAVTTRSSSLVYWELVPIESTCFWKRFVNVSLRRGLPQLVLFVQPYEKVNAEAESARASDEATVVERVVENNVNELNEIGDDKQGEASETVREPRGVIDEGEEILGLWEDTEADVRVDEDSDHEDDALNQVLSRWANYDHSQRLVNEGETVTWEYSENQVCVGAIYHSIIELKEAVQRWSAKCLKKESKELNTIHACLKSLRVNTVTLIADFVAQHMYSKIINNLGYEPKAIINSIEYDFQYKISYSKAYKAKQNALEMR